MNETYVYFRTDLHRLLLSTALSKLSVAVAHGSTNAEYCRGILDTIHTQAIALGLSWPDLRQALTEALHDDAKDKIISDLIHLGVLSSLDNK